MRRLPVHALGLVLVYLGIPSLGGALQLLGDLAVIDLPLDAEMLGRVLLQLTTTALGLALGCALIARPAATLPLAIAYGVCTTVYAVAFLALPLEMPTRLLVPAIVELYLPLLLLGLAYTLRGVGASAGATRRSEGASFVQILGLTALLGVVFELERIVWIAVQGGRMSTGAGVGLVVRSAVFATVGVIAVLTARAIRRGRKSAPRWLGAYLAIAIGLPMMLSAIEVVWMYVDLEGSVAREHLLVARIAAQITLLIPLVAWLYTRRHLADDADVAAPTVPAWLTLMHTPSVSVRALDLGEFSSTVGAALAVTAVATVAAAITALRGDRVARPLAWGACALVVGTLVLTVVTFWSHPALLLNEGLPGASWLAATGVLAATRRPRRA